MAKTYTGSLTLEWYNKQRSIALVEDRQGNLTPAPIINWVNRENSLFYEIDEKDSKGVKPFWVNKNDIRVKEARPLIFKKAYKAQYDNKSGSLSGFNTKISVKEIIKESEVEDVENILIKGDNLLALNSIKKHFENISELEKVKCIYIDPPFNTGQAFEYYDDNLAHSEWLTLMRDRLVVLKSLLRYDGFIIVHLDNSEAHYCKVVLDEIFGRENFISHIAYERSSVAGLGQGGLIVNTAESILVYHNGIPSANIVYEIEGLPISVMKRYNRYISKFGKRELVKELTSKSNDMPIKIYRHHDYVIENISMAKAEERYDELLEEYKKNIETIFRPFLVQQENEFQHELLSYMDSETLYSVDYVPSRGKNKNKDTTLFYLGNGLIAWLKDTTETSEEGIGKKTRLSNFLRHSEIPKADLHNEGGVSFARNKKPENLLQKLIEFTTDEGDTVLDCFGGSGTTFAVAHKMKRNWIGIEIGNHADTHIIPRLKSVIDGSDQLGITKKVNWAGGGAFKYYHLGPSIIKIGKDNSSDFNWSLGKNFIEESLLLSYDYTIDKTINLSADRLFSDKDNQPAIGIQKIGSKYRVAIVSLNDPEGKLCNITYDELYSIYKTVKNKYSPEYINIFTNRGIEIAYDTKPDDLEVIKVPHAIFAELEK